MKSNETNCNVTYCIETEMKCIGVQRITPLYEIDNRIKTETN